MNEKPTIDVNKVKPITKFIYTLGVLPTSYLMSMTYEEQITWLCNYIMQTLIPAINDDVAAVQELQGLYVDLQDYVNNYLDNLNVEQDVNDKIDEMAQNGTLTRIIKDYVDPLYQGYQESINAQISIQNNAISDLRDEIENVVSTTPIAVTSISDMEDTSQIYVLTTDGYWYYYDGDSWERGGVYQAAASSGDIEDLQEAIEKIYSNETDISYSNSTSSAYEFIQYRRYLLNVTITTGSLNLATRQTSSGSNYETIKNGITSNQIIEFIPQKAGGNYLRISISGGATGTIKIIDTLSLTQLNVEVDQLKLSGDFKNSYDANYSRPQQFQTVKPLLTDMNGYPYVSFGNGIYHKGKEIFVERASIGHTSPVSSDDYGKIIAIVRDENGTITSSVLNLPYSSIDGELRDPNLSISRYDNKLLLGCFATKDVSGTKVHSSALFVLNDDLSLSSWCMINSEDADCKWGNTLQTPNGYLITAAYNNSSSPYDISIFRSDSPFEGSLSEMTFTKISTTFNQTTQSANTEPSLGYWNDKLIMVSRFGFWTTEDLEGLTGWSENRTTFSGEVTSLHSPQIPITSTGELILSGCIHISDSLRKPIVCRVNTETGKVVEKAFIYDNSDIYYGGYPAFVKLDENLYSTIFYLNASNGSSTALKYTQYNMLKMLNTHYNK